MNVSAEALTVSCHTLVTQNLTKSSDMNKPFSCNPVQQCRYYKIGAASPVPRTPVFQFSVIVMLVARSHPIYKSI